MSTFLTSGAECEHGNARFRLAPVVNYEKVFNQIKRPMTGLRAGFELVSSKTARSPDECGLPIFMKCMILMNHV